MRPGDLTKIHLQKITMHEVKMGNEINKLDLGPCSLVKWERGIAIITVVKKIGEPKWYVKFGERIGLVRYQLKIFLTD